jgi:hypothetical protein
MTTIDHDKQYIFIVRHERTNGEYFRTTPVNGDLLYLCGTLHALSMVPDFTVRVCEILAASEVEFDVTGEVSKLLNGFRALFAPGEED